ncbi:MAG: transposase [Gammaproteobacteria bacterium]|nr:transposase [Gammaproteobacteria bacterium]
MMRTASIKLGVTAHQAAALAALQAAYADACNRLVPLVQEHRLWNRVSLHNRAYDRLRAETPLGSQMVCNAIYTVCKAYKAQRQLGRICKDTPVPSIRFDRASVHFDKRTYSLKDEIISLYTLGGRVSVSLRKGEHQRRILESGTPKEAELLCRKGQWYFNLVVESDDAKALASGPVMGLDVGENNLAAASTGKLWGGEALRHRRDRYLALRRRLQSNGSQSARQLLRKISGKEMRRVKQINHETSKAILAEAIEHGIARITMEDLTHIRDRIKAGKRMRGRLHRWAFRQLQGFVEYKAHAHGIEVVYVDPAYSSRTCSGCGGLGRRARHRFVCEQCGLRAHADLNASRNLARIGGTAVLPRAAVNTPDVANVGREVHVLQ